MGTPTESSRLIRRELFVQYQLVCESNPHSYISGKGQIQIPGPDLPFQNAGCCRIQWGVFVDAHIKWRLDFKGEMHVFVTPFWVHDGASKYRTKRKLLFWLRKI